MKSFPARISCYIKLYSSWVDHAHVSNYYFSKTCINLKHLVVVDTSNHFLVINHLVLANKMDTFASIGTNNSLKSRLDMKDMPTLIWSYCFVGKQIWKV